MFQGIHPAEKTKPKGTSHAAPKGALLSRGPAGTPRACSGDPAGTRTRVSLPTAAPGSPHSHLRANRRSAQARGRRGRETRRLLVGTQEGSFSIPDSSADSSERTGRRVGTAWPWRWAPSLFRRHAVLLSADARQVLWSGCGQFLKGSPRRLPWRCPHSQHCTTHSQLAPRASYRQTPTDASGHHPHIYAQGTLLSPAKNPL